MTFTQTRDDDPRGGQAETGTARASSSERAVRRRGSPPPSVVAGWARAVQRRGHAARLGRASPARVAALAVGYAWGWIEFIAIGLGRWCCSWPRHPCGSSAGARRRSSSRCPRRASVVGEQADARLDRGQPRAAGAIGGAPSRSPSARGVVERVLPGPRERRRLRASSSASRPSGAGSSRSARPAPCAPTRSGLMRREIVWSQTVELHVHPRTIAIAALSTGLHPRPRGVADPRPHRERHRVPRAARVRAGRRSPLHPLEERPRRPARSWCASSRRPGAAGSWCCSTSTPARTPTTRSSSSP